MHNDSVEIQIHDLGSSGEGVGTLNGLTVFVEGALPHEIVRATIFLRKKTYAKAKLEEVLKKSPFRVIPSCPLFGICGGCQLMHLSYSAQLEIKRKRVNDTLQRIGHFKDVNVAECIPSPSSLNYRNKIQLPILYDSNGIKVGLYARNSHDIIPIEKCYIHCEEGEKILEKLIPLLQKNVHAKYLRHILIKSTSFESLVIFVTREKASLFLSPLAKEIMSICPSVKGVIENVNLENSNSILGSKFHVLSGSSHIEDSLNGLKFKISPSSFFQVNPAQAEQIYQKVIELAELTPSMTFLDAFCGVGTIALIASRFCAQSMGIECVSQAIEDAQDNAIRNQIKNCQFLCGFAEKLLPTLKKRWDVIFLNPPRKGCDPTLLQTICKNRPKRLIYMSCDPATLARDLAILHAQGYQIGTVFPFDMFPQTSHVECVVSLTLSPNLD